MAWEQWCMSEIWENIYQHSAAVKGRKDGRKWQMCLYWYTVEELLSREEESFCKVALSNFSKPPNKHTFKVIALLNCIKKLHLRAVLKPLFFIMDLLKCAL